MNCTLLECDDICTKDCKTCQIIGDFKQSTMYKYGKINGLYDVCCPLCRREKHDVSSIVQGDCETCKYNKYKE